MSITRDLPFAWRACIAAAGMTLATAGCDSADSDGDPPPPGSVLEAVENLPLERLGGPVPTYYSPGARERAQSLQAWLREADVYFQGRLAIRPSYYLAVLDEEHWAAVTPAPYGVPFVSESPKVVVLPAIPERAAVVQIYGAAQAALPAHAAEELARVEVSYEEAVLRVLDLIGFHEVGHVYIAQLGYQEGNTARWLEELLATYAAYCYLQASDPTAIVVWDALSEALIEFVEPGSRSLDDFNRLYIQGLGPATYGWFQSHFNLRDAVVVAQRPHAGWFSQLEGAGLAGDTRTLLTSELLLRLDATVPGFTEWANAAGLEYE